MMMGAMGYLIPAMTGDKMGAKGDITWSFLSDTLADPDDRNMAVGW